MEFLVFHRILEKIRERGEGRNIYLTLTIPNEEIVSIYENSILEWFEQKIKVFDFKPMYQALFDGDCGVVEEMIRQQLRECISYYDSEERFYHGFLLGLLGAVREYRIVSNRESGNGRPDILLIPYDERRLSEGSGIWNLFL